jgi:hypothetical protein
MKTVDKLLGETLGRFSTERIAVARKTPKDDRVPGEEDEGALPQLYVGGPSDKPVTFALPEKPSSEEVALSNDFVRIDHRSLHTLPPKSKERGEVRDLLVNVASFLESHQTEAARSLLTQAEGVWQQHLQARNRLRYLLGMLAGIFVLFVFGVVLVLASDPHGALEKVMPVYLLPLVLLFSGMGAMTSVLTRLSSIDLRDQTSVPLVFISGMARPVTAVFFALVVSLLLGLRVLDFHIGIRGGEDVPPALFLVAAFLCGFSERFAEDVLARFAAAVLFGAATPIVSIGPGTNYPRSSKHAPNVVLRSLNR